jgi:hypothetical protein
MKYKSILVVTYGRSGSTLLQGLLNSIDNVTIRGENYDFCWGLYLSWKSLQKSVREFGHERSLTPKNPWYGAQELNPEQFIEDAKEIVKKQLIPLGSDDVCYGFKEIRYIDHLGELDKYLDFLQKIFPNPAIIFNTRNHANVETSGFWPKRNIKDLSKHLRLADKLFYVYALKNPNTFIMRYEHMIRGVAGVRALFEFLECALAEEKIMAVLDTPHSYAPKESTLEAAKNIGMNTNKKSLIEEFKTPEDLRLETRSKLKKFTDGVMVLSIIKDDMLRLPWFLEYYRNLGVRKFLFIDNGSRDGTPEFLLKQDDVMLFHGNEENFTSSRCGREWINSLVLKYALHKWVLVVDVDELICWPYYQREGLSGLTKRAERLGLKKVFTPMIDAYSEKATSEMDEYIPGDPFGEACRWIDPVDMIKAIWLKDTRLVIYSGPRARFHTHPNTQPPIMTKQTLYYVEKDGYKHRGPHFDTTLAPSPLVAPLLHYKFLPDFSAKLDNLLKKGDSWVAAQEYKNYKNNNLENIKFKTEHSVLVHSGLDLVPYINAITQVILNHPEL